MPQTNEAQRIIAEQQQPPPRSPEPERDRRVLRAVQRIDAVLAWYARRYLTQPAQLTEADILHDLCTDLLHWVTQRERDLREGLASARVMCDRETWGWSSERDQYLRQPAAEAGAWPGEDVGCSGTA